MPGTQDNSVTSPLSHPDQGHIGRPGHRCRQPTAFYRIDRLTLARHHGRGCVANGERRAPIGMQGATIGDLIEGDDGLPAEKVGEWVKDKHDLLCGYIEITHPVRAMYLPPKTGGAAYIDLFCGPGRCFIEDTGEWIDGGAVAAWKASVRSGSPFTRVIIGDADPFRCDAATTRLKALGAPVIPIPGEAKDTAPRVLLAAPPYGLNFAFLDPYKLEALDFQIIRTLAAIKRIDMLIHVSTMDLQRNLDAYAQADPSPFDALAPGWKEVVPVDQSMERVRKDIVEYWRSLVAGAGVATSDDVKLVTGSKNQRLYWLLLAASHKLAHKFWRITVKRLEQGQGSLF